MTKEELIEKTDLAISELVYDKEELRKAYNYYNCKRDKELFKYLEENYGIGLPTAVEFIPLIRKHVDALVGEYLDVPIKPKVSCKDSETIHNIYREKQLKISAECSKLLQNNLKNNLLRLLGSKDMLDLNIKELLDKLIEDVNENFISEYEIAAQNVVEYIIQSRNIDLITKLKLLMVDLLVTGYTFYKVSPLKNNIQIRCLNPLEVFPELNYNSPYICDCKRAVIRTMKNRNEILSEYGEKLTREDISNLKETWKDFLCGSVYLRTKATEFGTPATDGLRAGQEVTPGFPDNWDWFNKDVIPVYEVEWIETDSNFVEQRYSTIRIGSDIYILNGKDEEVIRTKDNPNKARLSINGVWFNNRGHRPYSMVINCMVLQDKYDLLHFYRDNLIASSGTVGDFVNLPTLPTILGDDLAERLMKWKAYAKNGIKLLDTSLEGLVNTGLAPINTMFNGYDDTIKVLAIQAILLAIDSIEQTTSSITGVFRERLNGIQQRDAVTNVLVGINNSFTITKLWHYLMGLVTREILLDALDCAKIVYKEKGLTGPLILGNKLLKIFTALPKYFTLTDHDIHILTSTEIIKEMEQIKSLVPDFIKGGIVAPETLMDIITSKSLTEMKSKVNKSIRKLKAENNLILQLTQLLEEMLNRLLQSENLLLQTQKKLEALNEAKLEVEKEKIKLQYEVDMFNAKADKQFKEAKAENDTKRTEIELMLLYDGNPYNDEVKNI